MHTKPTRILITGAAGLLGSAIHEHLGRQPGKDVDAVGRPEMDITNTEAVCERLDAFGPDLVIHCAAHAAVDACEEDEETARRVNGVGAGIVAQATADRDIRLIHLSTDYVFEGSATVPYVEDDPTGPAEKLSAYGRSKLLGEVLVRKHHPAALIVRTSWLYGPHGSGFPDAILRRARRKEALRVVHDQTGSPTFAPDLAEAIFKFAHLDMGGIVHVTNAGHCTWYEFACEILRLAGIDAPVTPVTSGRLPRPAKRPAFSVLDNRRYIAAVGRPMRPWQEAIAEHVARQAERE